MIPKNVAGSGPVFDEARVRKLFGDRNRGCYTEACVVPHTLEWHGLLSGLNLQKALVLQRKSQKGICAFAIELKFAADIGAVVLDCSVMDGEFCADFFAGFSVGNQLHDAAFGRRKIARQYLTWFWTWFLPILQ